MKKAIATCICLTVLVLTAGILPTQAAEGGCWVLVNTLQSFSEPYTGLTRSVITTLSATGAEFITAGTNNEYEKASTAWSAPAAQLGDGGAIELQLMTSIIESVNCEAPLVTIYACVGKTGLDFLTASGSADYLTDKSGTFTCLTNSPGTTVLTVSGSLGAGTKGDKKAVYIVSYNNGQIAQCQYVFRWSLPGETSAQTETVAANGTTAAVTAAVTAAATAATTDGGSSVAFSSFNGSALRSIVVIAALLLAAIMLVLIRRKQKSGEGLTAHPLNTKNFNKFSRLRKYKNDDDDFSDGTFSVLCPFCQAPVKKSTKTCPRCGRRVR